MRAYRRTSTNTAALVALVAVRPPKHLGIARGTFFGTPEGSRLPACGSQRFSIQDNPMPQTPPFV